MLPLTLLKTYFGYDSFRPLQGEIIEHVLAGNSALVLMPTGGGKSLCYQLPALVFSGLTLVVSPLIALMKDQVDGLTANGVAAGFINSSLGVNEIRQLQERVEKGAVKLLYVAPERLATSGFKDWLSKQKICLIAIDEAHCISEWGHDFRPDYRNLAQLRRDFANVPMIALTATATPKVRDDISSQLNLADGRLFQSTFNRSNLNFLVEPKRNGTERLQELVKARPDQSVIVYCFSRKDTEYVAANLRSQGYSALAYHAGLSAEDRASTQNKFIRDEISVIVATIAFGMGIDKPDIRLVVHYDLPKTIEGYYQEVGRAGRDGLPSECVLFYSYGDSMKHSFFINQLNDDAERIQARKKLAQVVSYCEIQSCRRQFLLDYFGEAVKSGSCRGCDVCLQPAETFDATEISQKILSAVMRTGERFGGGYIAEVLRGSKTAKVLQWRHDGLSVFGIGRDYSAADLKSLMRLLVGKGLMMQSEGEYPILALTGAGRKFLSDRNSITLPKLAPARAGKAKAPKIQGLDYDKELFDRLRSSRRQLAEDQGVPPFVICGDRTLMELAYYLPQSNSSMVKIFGLGEQKIAQYGDKWIDLISAYANERGLIEKPKDTVVSRSEKVGSRAGATNYQTLELLKTGLSFSDIAMQRKLTMATIITHVESLVAEGVRVDLESQKPAHDKLDEIRAAAEAAGGWNYLSPIKAVVGDRYSYDELRIARLFESIDSSVAS